MTQKRVQRIYWNFRSAVMFGLNVAKMKIAPGSKMSELITGVFRGEEQYSTIIPPPALANFVLLLHFSCSYYLSAYYGILEKGNNLFWLQRGVNMQFKSCKYHREPEPVSWFLCMFHTPERGMVLFFGQGCLKKCEIVCFLRARTVNLFSHNKFWEECLLFTSWKILHGVFTFTSNAVLLFYKTVLRELMYLMRHAMFRVKLSRKFPNLSMLILSTFSDDTLSMEFQTLKAIYIFLHMFCQVSSSETCLFFFFVLQILECRV